LFIYLRTVSVSPNTERWIWMCTSYTLCTMFCTTAGKIQYARESHNSEGLAWGPHWCTHISKWGRGDLL